MIKVNPFGILFAAIAYIFLGIIFYSPYWLGRFWPNLVTHMQKQADGIPSKIYLGAFISAAIIAYAMGFLLSLTRAKSTLSAVLLGFLIWAGFILPTIFSPALFGKKPMAMFWLDSIYYLIAYISIALITMKFNKNCKT